MRYQAIGVGNIYFCTLAKSFTMKIVLSLDENNEKAKAFLNFIKTLDFINVEKQADIPQWQKDKLDLYLQEHESGTAEYLEWDEVKTNLFDKYNA